MLTHSAPEVRIPSLRDDDHADLTTMLDQLYAHRRRNLLRSAYYDGKNASFDGFTSQLTPPTMRRLELVLGWSATAVDVLHRRCKLEGFNAGPSTLPVDDIYSANWLDTEAATTGISSLIHGVAFLVVTGGDVSKGEPPALITGRSALEGTGLWNGRTRKLRAFLAVNAYADAVDGGAPTDLTLYLPNRIITARRNGATWDTDERTHPYGVPVEPLVYKPRLGRPFGYSRISRPVMSLHSQALRTVLRSEVTAEIYQLPQRVLLGADASDFIDADGNPIPTWQTVMGAIWAIPDDEDGKRASLEQLTGASHIPYLDQLRMQAQLFAGETSIPLASLGIYSDANPTSADAYMASREDLIAEAEGTTDGWSPAWARAITTALAITERVSAIPEEWTRTITPRWRSPVFTSRAAAADAGVKQLTAVPWLAETSVGLELLGLSDEQIKRAESERRRAEGRLARRTVTLPPTQPVAAEQPQEVPDGPVTG